MFKNLKIGTRLSIGFITIIVILILLTLYGIRNMDIISQQTTLIYDHPLTVSNAVLRINTNIIKMHRSMKDIAMATDTESINNNTNLVNSLEKEVLKDFEIINERYLGEKEEHELALGIFTLWKPIRDEVISLMRKGKRKKAADITKGKGARHVEIIEKAMESLGNFAQHKAKDFLSAAETTKSNAFHMMYFLVGLTVLIAALLAYFITKSFTYPVGILSGAIEKIGRGQLDTVIEIKSKDEIGQLSASFNKMTVALKEITESRNERAVELESAIELLKEEIIQRKKAETDFSKFKFISDNANDAHFLIDKNAKFQYVNKSACKMMGYSEDELLKLGVPDVDVVYDLVKFQESFDLIQKETAPTVKTINKRKNGTTFPAEITITRHQIDGSLYMFAVLKDITERMKTEAALKESESNLKAVYDNAGNGILVTDIDTMKFHASNKMMCHMLGYSQEEIKHIGVMDIHPEEDLPYVIEQFDKLSRNEINTVQDITFKRKDGHIFYADISASIIIFSGKKCVLSIFKDITDRKQAEKALKKAKEEIEAWNRKLEKRVREKSEELIMSQTQLIQSEKLSAMGQMAGGLAHELNSPLAGLLPMIELYRNEAKKDSKAYNELSLMLKACEYMAKIVRDFSSFSRESKAEYYELNLNEVIDDTLSFITSIIKQKGIQVIKEYKNNLPNVKGEKTELQQVILNMTTNALDALSEGDELILRTGISKDEKNVMIEFIDNGTGIEKESLDKIFDPFYTTKRPGKGTGLGLSVSYKIIEKHGGNISVESEPGKGTEFTIYLPAVKSNNT